MRLLLVTTAFALFSLPAGAEDLPTISLTDTDTGKSQMEECLSGQKVCSARKITIDDLVNFKVVPQHRIDTNASLPVADPSAATSVQISNDTALPSIDIEILFDTAASTLRSDQYGKLSELAALLKSDAYKDFGIVFQGHTDQRGAFDYNMDLSRARASSVAAFVAQEAGLPEDRVFVDGRGFTELKSPEDPAGEQNRRVQFILVPLKQ